MKKVKAFKNSNGELFENEKKYILSESKIQRSMILDNWERLTKMIKSNPENYLMFIKEIGDKIIDEKTTKEDLQKEFDNVNSIFNKEKEIKYKNYNGKLEQVEQEPYLWGNDILDGHDVNR